MADQSIPRKNSAYTLRTTLTSQADVNIMQDPPTVAAGDVRVSTDGGALGNTTNAPSLNPAGGVVAEVVLTATEMNGDIVVVPWHDVVGAQWQDQTWVLFPTDSPLPDIACDVWACPGRTLTMTAAELIAVAIGPTPTQTRAVDWSFSITGMGSVAARDTLYFTLKRKTILPDHEALVQIEEAAGLVFINGKPAGVAGAGNGTLTVTDALVGDVTVTVTAAETAKLSEEAGLDYDFKMVTVAGAVQQMTAGKFNISSVVTEAIT